MKSRFDNANGTISYILFNSSVVNESKNLVSSLTDYYLHVLLKQLVSPFHYSLKRIYRIEWIDTETITKKASLLFGKILTNWSNAKN